MLTYLIKISNSVSHVLSVCEKGSLCEYRECYANFCSTTTNHWLPNLWVPWLVSELFFFLFVAVCEEGWCCDPRTTDLWFSTCRFWFLFLSFLKLLIYRCIKSIFVFSSSCKFDEVCIKFYIGYPIWALLKLFSVLVIESSPLLYFQI